jgi:type IV pilus assembly protein PilV
MVEVIVAMLLLSIGVLGFSALQARALSASSEGMVRTQAMQIARDLAERIRVNRSAYAQYVASIAAPTTGNDCVTAYCNSTNLAKYDVQQVVARAQSIGATIAFPVCSGVLSATRCIYVAWGSTTPTDNTATQGGADCTYNGNYNSYNTTNKKPTTCVMVEAY